MIAYDNEHEKKMSIYKLSVHTYGAYRYSI